MTRQKLFKKNKRFTRNKRCRLIAGSKPIQKNVVTIGKDGVITSPLKKLIDNFRINFDDGYEKGEYRGQVNDEYQREGKGIMTNYYSYYKGEWNEDKKNGKGTMDYTRFSYNKDDWMMNEGSRYEGDWMNNMRHGKGIMRYTDSYFNLFVYEGEWNEDKKKGHGMMSISNSKKNYKGTIEYEGIWDNNILIKGKLTYDNGSVYEGEFIFNDMGRIYKFLPYGHGIMKFISTSSDKFDVYSKDFTNFSRFSSLFHDRLKFKEIGDITFSNGNIFSGTVEFMYEGFVPFLTGNLIGTMAFKKGDDGYDVYKGFIEDGKKHGDGEIKYKNADIYVGKFNNDKKHGYGTMKYADDGREYKGYWDSDKKQGKGTMTYADGSKYEGEWLNDMRHGKGTTTKDHEVSHNTWSLDKIDGIWRVKDKNHTDKKSEIKSKKPFNFFGN